MTRVVPDTNIIISAIFWSGKPYRVISRGLKGEYQLVTSPEIIDEVLTKLRNKFQFPEDKIEEQANILMSLFHMIIPTAKVDVVRDKSDNKIMGTITKKNIQSVFFQASRFGSCNLMTCLKDNFFRFMVKTIISDLITQYYPVKPQDPKHSIKSSLLTTSQGFHSLKFAAIILCSRRAQDRNLYCSSWMKSRVNYILSSASSR